MLTANTPHVVHETIDGETILLHLKTGNYYSFDALGALIWQSIIESGSIKELMSKDLLDQDQIKEVDTFVNRLVEEELLKEVSSIENSALENSSELFDQFIHAVKEFKPPILNKYSDMQELLLLDPIHDVDEGEGWPEAKS